MRFFATPAAHEMAHTPAQPERRGWLKRLGAVLGGSLLAGTALGRTKSPASVMGMDPFLGEIAMVGFNFPPQGWALCDGQTMSISQYSALFALLGTQFGGNGTTTFNLPDLRGRLPVHQGSGNGLSPRVMGQTGGEENVTLTTDQMPNHSHTLSSSNDLGDTATPAGNLLANNGAGIPQFATTSASGTSFVGGLGTAGSNQPHDNMPPFLCVSFIIALQGSFPQRY